MDETLKQKINSISESDLKMLVRERRDFEFTDISNELNALRRFAADLLENEGFYENLPENLQNDLIGHINNVSEIFNQIETFKPQDIPNPQAVRDDLSRKIKDAYKNLYDFFNRLEIYLLKVVGKQAELSNITKEAKKTLQEAKSAKKEILNLAESTKKTASKVPLYKYLGIFSETSDKHRKIAKYFGISSIGIAIALCFLLFFISKDLSDTILQLQSIQAIFALVITKLFFLAVVIFLLRDC